MVPTGAYSADRAAALSGVPKSTIHDWARKTVLVPSVSVERVKLWSYADLMGLRIIYWLRQKKTREAGSVIPPTSMPAIVKALARLRDLGEPLWHPDKLSLLVNAEGELFVNTVDGPESVRSQQSLALFNLVAPFTSREGMNGPDLAKPRPEVRIVPGKMAGSPHIVGTRLETQTLAALARDGLDRRAIHQLYPFASLDQIGQAIDLEKQLDANLAIAHAA
jgi:uncharacterized protein (DUF433 family)